MGKSKFETSSKPNKLKPLTAPGISRRNAALTSAATAALLLLGRGPGGKGGLARAAEAPRASGILNDGLAESVLVKSLPVPTPPGVQEIRTKLDRISELRGLAVLEGANFCKDGQVGWSVITAILSCVQNTLDLL